MSIQPPTQFDANNNNPNNLTPIDNNGPSFSTTPTTQRNPSSDLLFIINQIVECDNRFCWDLKDMYSDGLGILMQIKYPEMHRDLLRCTQQGRSELECSPLFVEGIARVNPLFHQMVYKRRLQVQPDPLGPSYDGLLYNAPFWFEGAGEIWRRTMNGSTRVSVRDCDRVKHESEQCLNDPTKPTDFCFRLYAGATMCTPGANCPYLHFPLIKCAQSTPGVDYQMFNDCVKRITNFEQCSSGHVALNAEEFKPSAKQQDPKLEGLKALAQYQE